MSRRSSHPPARPRALRRFGVAGALALAFAALVWLTLGVPGALGQPSRIPASPPRPPILPGVAAPEATPMPPPPDPLEDLEALEPPDGKWEKEEDGREFFVTRLPKVKDTYYIYPGGEMVQYKRLYRWPLVKHDDQYLYVKLYRSVDLEAERKALEERKRQAEKAQASKQDDFVVEERRVDRLSFVAFDQGLPREGQWRQGFDVADINGDGHLDIVHGPARKGAFQPIVFLGDGAGGWRFWEEAVWPDVPYDYGDAAVGDVNGDGLPDVALGVHLRGVLVLIQEAPGRFANASEGLLFSVPGRGGDATGFGSRAVELADWNGDGRLDLIALGEGARQASTSPGDVEGLPFTSSYGVVVFVNNGDGTWTPRSRGAYRGVFGDSFAFGDWNDDGRVDLASSSYTMGDRGVLFLNADTPEGWLQTELESLRPRAWTYGVTAADFDQDGRQDLVTSFGVHDGERAVSGLELSTRDAKGVWRSRLLHTDEGTQAAWAIASGDLDGDGHLDVVATTHMGQVIVLLGDGKGGFARQESPEIDAPAACRGYGLRLVDLDRDGRSEIMASFAGEMGEMERLLGHPECHGQGSLRVWRAVPKTAGPAAAS